MDLPLTPILHETSYEYDTGSVYLYRILWSSEWGYYKLQRRIKPLNPHSFAARWPRSVEVENYTGLKEFDPSAYSRPIMKFLSREDAERVIRDDTAIAGIVRKREVEHKR